MTHRPGHRPGLTPLLELRPVLDLRPLITPRLRRSREDRPTPEVTGAPPWRQRRDSGPRR